MTKTLRLAFMGSPDFAVPVLEALVEAGHDIRCVYSQPPRRAGRGKQLRPTPVQACAEAIGLEVRTPHTLKTVEAQKAFAALDLDAAVVVAYGLILPKAILEAPRLGCMNMHASLLPRWRGAAPIHRAVMAGDEVTGVQAMVMEEGLDTGPILATEKARIFPFDTTGSLHDRLSDLAADLAVRALEGWVSGVLTPQPQPELGVVYAHKIGAEDRRIDWSQPARAVDCQIRGLSPFPGAWFELKTNRVPEPIRVRALASRLAEDCDTSHALPGTVIDESLTVLCGDGQCVRLLELQKPGSRAMPVEDALRGLPIPPGTRLT